MTDHNDLSVAADCLETNGFLPESAVLRRLADTLLRITSKPGYATSVSDAVIRDFILREHTRDMQVP